MKKIPTLFVRVFENRRIVDIKNNITPGCEDAFLRGIATVKIDGSCCAVINGVLYKRYDAKQGKPPPSVRYLAVNQILSPATGHIGYKWITATLLISGSQGLRATLRMHNQMVHTKQSGLISTAIPTVCVMTFWSLTV